MTLCPHPFQLVEPIAHCIIGAFVLITCICYALNHNSSHRDDPSADTFPVTQTNGMTIGFVSFWITASQNPLAAQFSRNESRYVS